MPYLFTASAWAHSVVLGAGNLIGGFYSEPSQLVGKLKFELNTSSKGEGTLAKLRFLKGEELVGLFVGHFVGTETGYMAGEGYLRKSEPKKN